LDDLNGKVAVVTGEQRASDAASPKHCWRMGSVVIADVEAPVLEVAVKELSDLAVSVVS